MTTKLAEQAIEAVRATGSGRIVESGIALHRYSATRDTGRDPILLLHGWGCDSDCWQPLLPALRAQSDVIAVDLPGFGASEALPSLDQETLLQQLERLLPERATLLGWSLGGMLAVALADRRPDRVKRVMTLASNVSFVARPDWRQALSRSVYRQFKAGFQAEAQTTWRRFVGLMARGDDEERALLKRLRANFSIPTPVNDNWGQALALLAEMDNSNAFARLQQPGLHLFGDADALVPATAADALTSHNPRQRVKRLQGAAHALHWSCPEAVAAQIAEFLDADASRLDKRRVAASFSRAAPSYDRVARLQAAVSERLLTFVPASAPEKSDACVLDLGCGTGRVTRQLARLEPQASILGLDLAEGMLRFANQRRPGAAAWVCGDAETLPLATASVDVIYSSLSIQWCQQLPLLFRELRRVLKPKGSLVFTTLGPDTLYELRQAWEAVDDYTHVNHFEPWESVASALADAGFAVQDCRREKPVLHYRHLADLTRELKALGAHNVNRGQPQGLTSRRKVQALKAAYESFRTEAGLPSSYEVYYCRAVPAQE